jgi:hypothetical protein
MRQLAARSPFEGEYTPQFVPRQFFAALFFRPRAKLFFKSYKSVIPHEGIARFSIPTGDAPGRVSVDCKRGAIMQNIVSNVVRPFADPYWVTVLFASIVQLMLFLRWLYRRVRNEELTRTFVHDMAVNHLPHIYDLLEKICDQQGITRSQRPAIRWVDMTHTE